MGIYSYTYIIYNQLLLPSWNILSSGFTQRCGYEIWDILHSRYSGYGCIWPSGTPWDSLGIHRDVAALMCVVSCPRAHPCPRPVLVTAHIMKTDSRKCETTTIIISIQPPCGDGSVLGLRQFVITNNTSQTDVIQ